MPMHSPWVGLLRAAHNSEPPSILQPMTSSLAKKRNAIALVAPIETAHVHTAVSITLLSRALVVLAAVVRNAVQISPTRRAANECRILTPRIATNSAHDRVLVRAVVIDHAPNPAVAICACTCKQ